MSILQSIKNLPRKHLVIGIVGGLLVSVLALLLINSMVLGYPTSPDVYQYDYPAGTNAVSPLTSESVTVHGSGVALSNASYSVNYDEQTYYTTENGTQKSISEVSVDYQINNKDGVGYMERSAVSTGTVGNAQNQTVSVYENNSTAFIRNEVKNSTHWQETGKEPLVLSNQLELPQTLVSAIPHIRWEPTAQETRNGEEYVVYTVSGASESQMKYIDSVTSASGELLVSTETNIITYSVTVKGTRTLQSGEVVEVTKKQSLSYSALDNTTVPTRPDWAEKGGSNEDDGDDEFWNN